MSKGKLSREVQEKIKSDIKKFGGIKLDVGAGDNKQKGFIGMDIRPTKNADIVWSAEQVPYPLPAEIAHVVLASHLVEHLKPWLMVDIMNEWWRICKVGGQLWIAMPYAGSFGFFQDPTHIKAWNEATAQYFDPSKFLFNIYKPRPWQIIKNVWYEGGNLEIVFEKLPENHGIETPKGYDSIPEEKKPAKKRKNGKTAKR